MFGLFASKEEQELRRSHREYETCQKLRSAHLAEFRRDAYRELSFTYPDAVFVLNTNTSDFAVHSRSGKTTIFGTFCDMHYAKLDPVPANASAAERMLSVALFKEKLSYSKKGELYIDVQWNNRGLIGENSLHSWGKKGYHVDTELENVSLVGARVYINDKVIVKVDASKTNRSGEILKALYNEVVVAPKTTTNISALRFNLYHVPLWPVEIRSFTILYDGNQNFRTEAGHNVFRRIFGEFALFAASIEPDLHTLPDDFDPEHHLW